MATNSLKILGVLSLSEIQKWRNILGDLRFSQVLGYISSRIIEEDIFFQKNLYGVSPTRDIKLIIEYLRDIAVRAYKNTEAVITPKEFDILSESLIDSSLTGSLTNIINFSDLRNFLMIRKFGILPEHLLYRALLFKALPNISDNCNCILVEFLNNQIKFNILDEKLKLIEDIKGHAIDLIDNSSPDAVLFDNNATKIIETEKQKILNPMVDFCYTSNRSLSGLLNDPDTTEISSMMEQYYQFQEETGSKTWTLPRSDTELLFYLMAPGEFTKIFRDNNQGIEREFLYFSPYLNYDIWRINTYHKNKTAKYSILTNAIQNISLIPIADRITGILSNNIQKHNSQAYSSALLKNQMKDLIYNIKSLDYNAMLREPHLINISSNLNDYDIELELNNGKIQKEMISSNEYIKTHESDSDSEK